MLLISKPDRIVARDNQDAIQYAAWGVDYLKYDWCNTTTQEAKASYANIRKALDASGRPIVLSICEWAPIAATAEMVQTYIFSMRALRLLLA
jgi:uncharacterized protein YhjY with autotransporter beta-barrel domain